MLDQSDAEWVTVFIVYFGSPSTLLDEKGRGHKGHEEIQIFWTYYIALTGNPGISTNKMAAVW